MADPFARLGMVMVRGRWLVLAIWLILFVVTGGVLAPRAGSVLKGGGFIVPGSESDRAAQVLERDFDAGSRNSVVVVFHSPQQAVDTPEIRGEVLAATGRLRTVERVRAVHTFYETNDPTLVSPDRRTTTAVVVLDGNESELQDVVPLLRAQLATVTIAHQLTGRAALSYDSQDASEQDLRRAELIALPLILVLLLLVFRTIVSAAIPLILGAVSVTTALAAIYAIGSAVDTSIFALNTASMIGLGLGIDFSLIVISRYREERSAGRPATEAITVTMATAGRSITYSGVTVLLAMLLLTLLQFQLMIIRSISMAVMLVTATALLAGLTLLPALIGILGERLEWFRVLPRRRTPRPDGTGFWYRFSHTIMRRPWLWLVGALGLLALLALPLRDLSFYGAAAGALPETAESVRGVAALEAAFGANRLTPVQIVVRTGPNGVWRPEFLEALGQLTDALANDPRSQQVTSLATLARRAGLTDAQFRALTPDQLRAMNTLNPFVPSFVNVNDGNDTAIVTIISRYGQYGPEQEAFIRDMHQQIIPEIRQLRAYDIVVGGDTATLLDYRNALYGRFPLVIVAVTLLIFVILLMFFRSVFLPLKAIFLNLASIVATFGVLVLIFQHREGGELLGFTSLGALNVNILPILFTVLFSLSTDYEVFLLSRVGEYYRHTGDNEEAVAHGLEHTAGVITTAGLILIGTFGSFASATNLPIKELGVGLAIGIFLDATIVRVILVPATMRLAGRANWWIPAWLGRFVPTLSEGAAPAPATLPSPTLPVVGNAVTPLPVATPYPATTPEQAHSTIAGALRPVQGGDAIPLPQGARFLIGRNQYVDLRLTEAQVSRRHARIDYYARAQVFAITDLGSANGVHVNGSRITASTILRDGDTIEIGTSTISVFTFVSTVEMSAGNPLSAVRVPHELSASLAAD